MNGVVSRRPQNLDDEAAWISQYGKGKRVKHTMVILGLLATMYPIWGEGAAETLK